MEIDAENKEEIWFSFRPLWIIHALMSLTLSSTFHWAIELWIPICSKYKAGSNQYTEGIRHHGTG